MCIRDSLVSFKGCVVVVTHDRYFLDKIVEHLFVFEGNAQIKDFPGNYTQYKNWEEPVSYTHLRAHETVLDLVCRLLLEKKKNKIN